MLRNRVAEWIGTGWRNQSDCHGGIDRNTQRTNGEVGKINIYVLANVKKGPKWTTIRLHNLLLGGSGIDHRDGNGLNNRKENLRMATQSQNTANQGKRVQNTSGYKGVHRQKPYKKYRAKIVVNGKQHHLGYFQTAKEAALAYNEAAVKYFGEFARLNMVNL